MSNERRTVIYYFSGTGNNRFISKRLAERLGDAEIFPIKVLKAERKIPKQYKTVVFCVPSYHSHIPDYVARLLSTVEIGKEQHVYSIVGCGGNRGRAVADVREALAAKGITITGEYMVMLPGSYILSYNAVPKPVQALENLLAERKIKAIAKDILHKKGQLLHKDGMFYKEKEEPRLQAAIAEYKEIGRQFEVSNDCIGCGSCAKVCPVGNIHMKNGKPAFGGNCQQCMGCIQWCPKRAIDYQHTAGERKRYHHSKVTIGEMMK